MFQAAQNNEPPQGDVAIYSLLVEVLSSIYANTFFDFSQSLKTTVPILMNLALVQTFYDAQPDQVF